MHPAESAPRTLVSRRTATCAALVLPVVARHAKAADAKTAAGAITALQYHPQPRDSILDRALKAIWAQVRDETGGRLQVGVRADNNGVPEGEPQLLKEVQAGRVELFVLNGNILSQAAPACDIQGIPFVFDHPEEATRLWDGALGELLARQLRPTGVELIAGGALENGLKDLTTVDRPVVCSADLEGMRMRVPGGRLFIDFYKSLGAEPVVFNFNRLYDSLKARSVEGQENPLVVAVEKRLYEVCRHVSLTSHQWAGFNMIASRSFWEHLPPDIRDTIGRVVKAHAALQRAEVRAANTAYPGLLRDKGMTIHAADRHEIKAKLVNVGFYDRWRSSIGEEAWRLLERDHRKVY